MTKDEALNLALDCVSTLANARDWVGCTPNERWDEDEMYAELCNATICLKKSLSIIQEALAEQPAQKRPQNCGTGYCSCIECVMEPAQEPFGYFKPEPFGWTDCAETDEGAIALYERPQPSKPWVGLTQQDINIAFDDTQEGGGFDDFAHAIEAKLKEKNNG